MKCFSVLAGLAILIVVFDFSLAQNLLNINTNIDLNALNNLNNQLNQLINSNPNIDLNTINALNSQLQSIISSYPNVDLSTLNNINNILATLNSANNLNTQLSSLTNLINLLSGQNVNLNNLINSIPFDKTLGQILTTYTTLLPFQNLTQLIGLSNFSNILQNFQFQNLSNCLVQQLQNTQNVQACMSSYPFLANNLDTTMLSQLEFVLRLNLTSALDLLLLTTNLSDVFNQFQMQNLTSCLQKQLQNSASLDSCLSNYPLILNFLNLTTNANVSQMLSLVNSILNTDFRSFLIQSIQNPMFNNVIFNYIVQDGLKCLQAQMQDFTNLNPCVVNSPVFNGVLGQFNLSSSSILSQVNSILNLKLITAFNLFLNATKLNNYLPNLQLDQFKQLQNVTFCIVSQVQNPTSFNPCILSILVNPMILNSISSLIPSLNLTNYLNQFYNPGDLNSILQSNRLANISKCMMDQIQTPNSLNPCVFSFPEVRTMLSQSLLRNMSTMLMSLYETLNGTVIPMGNSSLNSYVFNLATSMRQLADLMDQVKISSSTTTSAAQAVVSSTQKTFNKSWKNQQNSMVISGLISISFIIINLVV